MKQNAKLVKNGRTGANWLVREMQRYGALYVMLLVPFAILILFKYAPMYGIQIAFKDYKMRLVSPQAVVILSESCPQGSLGEAPEDGFSLRRMVRVLFGVPCCAVFSGAGAGCKAA